LEYLKEGLSPTERSQALFPKKKGGGFTKKKNFSLTFVERSGGNSGGREVSYLCFLQDAVGKVRSVLEGRGPVRVPSVQGRKCLGRSREP